MKGIIFDLDGTLVDSIPGIAVGVLRACRSLGYDDIPEEAVRGMVGKGAWKLCERCLDNLGMPATSENVEVLEQAFVREYGQTWMPGTQIYRGLPGLLRKISGKGIYTGVLTNKPHDIAVELVQYVFKDIIDFRTVQGAVPGTPRKPDPTGLLRIIDDWRLEPHEIVYVGDSRTDGETAQRADVKCLIVDWGYDDSPAETAREYAAGLIGSAEELERALNI